MSTLNVNNILDRVRDALGISTDTALAKELDVSQQVVSNWRSRGSMDFQRVVDRAVKDGVDLRWLLIGEHSQVDGVRRMIVKSPGGSAVTIDIEPDSVVLFE